MSTEIVFTETQIPGWDCRPNSSNFVCKPSDEYIRTRAYYRFVTQNPPGATPFAYWITAKADFIEAGGNDLPPL